MFTHLRVCSDIVRHPAGETRIAATIDCARDREPPIWRTRAGRVLAVLALLAVGPLPAAQSGSFRGVTPGSSGASLLLDAPEWGKPDEQQIVDTDWRLWVYRKAELERVEVLLYRGVVHTIDVIPARNISPRDAVALYGLGDLIPAHRLPLDAQIGPFLPRTWSFHRTRGDAMIFHAEDRLHDFSQPRDAPEGALRVMLDLLVEGPVDHVPQGEDSETESRVKLIRFFRSSADADAPSAGAASTSRGPVRLGVNVRPITADVAPRYGVQPGAGLLITGVTPGMPADRMGLRVDDVLVEYDGRPVRDLEGLQRVLQQVGIEGRHSVEIVRERNRAILDVRFPRASGRQPEVSAERTMEPGELDAVAPVVDVDARLAHDATPPLEFADITPLVTTEAELMSHPDWGAARETRALTNSLSLFNYEVRQYDVWVSVWDGRVQTVDVRLPAGVRERQIVTGSGLGDRREDRDLPPEAMVGTDPDPNWRMQRYGNRRVILFLEGADPDPRVRMMRFHGRPPRLADQLARVERDRPDAGLPAVDPLTDSGAKQDGSSRGIVNSIGMRFAWIPAGRFQMGSHESPEDLVAAFGQRARSHRFDDERPQRTVTISRPFYLGIHEVTVGQFEQFVQATGYQTDAERGVAGGVRSGSKDVLAEERGATWRRNTVTQDAREPVIHVSWNDAVAFCRWLSDSEDARYRLPTEAEWEYAARAGTTTRYSCGDDPESLLQVANVLDTTAERRFPEYKSGTRGSDGFAMLAPVGSFRPNRFGLYDMHGNVWEWCSDWYDPRYYLNGPTRDPQGPATGQMRVFRGGCWF